LRGGSADLSFTVSADKLGNVFIAGRTSRSSDNQPGIGGPIVGAEDDAYIAKYDASGNLRWARKIATTETDQAWSVSADGLGSVYVTGDTGGNLGAPNGGSADAFLGKYDAAGNVLWIQQLGGSGFDYAEGVFSDKFGNAYVVGETEGSLGGPNAGGYDAFVAKYDPAGNQLWFNQFGTATTDYALSVSGDALGNIFTAGVTDGSLGGPNAGKFDTFVRKYDSAGNVLWTRQLGSSAEEGYSWFARIGVSADGAGDVFLSGATTGNLGGPNAGGPYRVDPFLAKLDDAGNLLWIKQFGTSTDDEASGVSADGLGNIYVSGSTVCLGPTCTVQDYDAFIAKFHDDGPVSSPGDFNADGSVNAADYVVWRNGLGTAFTQADYDVWRAHFGQTAGSAGATAGLASSANLPVPEPTTAAVALFALALLLCVSRAHHAGLPGWKPVCKPERTTERIPRPHRARLGEAMFLQRHKKHRSTQTSCEGAQLAVSSTSGFETAVHGASSCGANPHLQLQDGSYAVSPISGHNTKCDSQRAVFNLRRSRALALADAAVAEAPQRNLWLQFRGIALYRLGQYQAAISALQKAATPSGTNDVVEVLFIAMSHWQLGNQNEAKQWYAKVANQSGANHLDRTSVYDIFAAPKADVIVEARELLDIHAISTAEKE
jgi:hypothetical protein